jgi:hypothetical protein
VNLLLTVRRPGPDGAITLKHYAWNHQEYHATQQAYNGSAWQCYLCPNAFDTVALLNNHVNSSVHRQEIYHCTNPSCAQQFPSLSQLFGHLEVDRCSFMRFDHGGAKTGEVDGFQFVALTEI